MRIVVRGLAAAAAIAAVSIAGCATTATESHVAELRRVDPHPAIVLMPLDVELTEMDVGGILEPKPDWTAKAREFITAEIRSRKARLGYNLRSLDDFAVSDEENELVDQLTRVQALIGRTIMQNRRPLQKVYGLGEKPQWSLGEEVQPLRSRTGADYALFIYVRDSYASDGRKLVMVAGAALHIGMLGGIQSGFASLVDLRTGDVVWFNQMGRAAGDLRTPDAAAESVNVLLTDFPK